MKNRRKVVADRSYTLCKLVVRSQRSGKANYRYCWLRNKRKTRADTILPVCADQWNFCTVPCSYAREKLDCTGEGEITGYLRGGEGKGNIRVQITWRTCSDWSRTNGGASLPRDFPYLSSWLDVDGETRTRKNSGLQSINQSYEKIRVELYIAKEIPLVPKNYFSLNET